jgi:hypothetical protein
MNDNRKKAEKKIIRKADIGKAISATFVHLDHIGVSTEKNSLSVQDLGSLRFKLTFENTSKQKTKISLVDKENNVFFYDYPTNDSHYVKAFDLSNLIDGEYAFVVELGTEKLKKDFVISTKSFRGIALSTDRK